MADPKPLISPSPHIQANPNQPPLNIISTPPAAGQSVSLEATLANAEKTVNAAK